MRFNKIVQTCGMGLLLSLGAAGSGIAQEEDKAAEATLAQPSSPKLGSGQIIDEPRQIRLKIDLVRVDGNVMSESGADTARDIGELAEIGKLQSLTQYRLTGIEGEPATLHLGEQVFLVTGRQIRPDRGGFGTAAHTVSRESTGTQIAATSRVTPKGNLVVELKLEQTRLENPAPAVAEASSDGPLPNGPKTLIYQSTVVLAPGKPELVSGVQMQTPEGPTELLLLITGTIGE